jgi:hypothetical protein
MQSPTTPVWKRCRDGTPRATAVALFVLLGSGCTARSPSGTYADASGATRYEFRTDGQVYISVLGATVTGAYETDRDRVLISGPQGTVVLLRKADRLQGPMGLELLPQPDQPASRGDRQK